MGKKLRSGYTTGACAAAAARAAVTAVLTRKKIKNVDVTFPDESIVTFDVTVKALGNKNATALVVKDAGDDPDVTNGAVIAAEITIQETSSLSHEITVKGGIGVGKVTKPGLAVDVGNPAINPVPMRMIKQNVEEALATKQQNHGWSVRVVIMVPDGIELAKKTLNARLGIIGGISILGTTGIVRPISAEAWTATIKSSLDVAEANGIREIVLSTGRTSEKCFQKTYNPPEEALVMMGDYLHFSLTEVRSYSFTKVHMSAMWAKLLKGAMGSAQTHVRHGVLEIEHVRKFFENIGVEESILKEIDGSNTAREILELLLVKNGFSIIESVCDCAVEEYEKISGKPVAVHLVDGRGNLICTRGN